jgi:prophage antirepressor-like protein
MDADKLTPFLFEGETIVHIIDRDGQPWFVAADVCRALGLLNPADVVKSLDDDEKGIDSIYTPGGRQEVIIISESGMFALIFKSRKAEAQRFRRWVTGEVLPALRKNGTYSTTEAPKQTRKPFGEWSQDETRTAMAMVRLAGETWNAAAWMWEYLGLPMPPPKFLPGWYQVDLFASQPNG